MSEHQKETAFLRDCIRYDESPERQQLADRLTETERGARCVRGAVWLMAMMAALAGAGFGYGAVLLDNFSADTSPLVAKIISTLGLAAMICLVPFAGLGMVYRRKLDQRRQECRQLVMTLLASRLGKPVIASSQVCRDDEVNRTFAPAPVASDPTPVENESADRGKSSDSQTAPLRCG